MKKILGVVGVLGILVCGRAAMAATVYVDGSNVSGTEDGSWRKCEPVPILFGMIWHDSCLY